ncbi:methylated-DNA--[protein]-cysteine S-methyltransferase [Staphylococcus auricularis]|uniref:Methylated-DNA--protein-cysteine methyltransferase n=1 Tax=Staphylococcus auricularis TaxID=29379 RepID=A0ABX5IH14_9STAP|nr:methylated-DNA--[protein]-cysteine S-methyltransferase [Staphylococcus auricularis]MCE5038844.1 methylated-DNA--[protein]-cysteine S-methyltransferase [Staphylococcus auricularis]MEB6570646.1 methylated-DNA--[protein]-cysteine S-methyltransferase [Staphylococcus auricularis]PTH18900.1 methylated-DNA--[protein]-cysteine S-methyltransferase [Staphylococcus auricularis]PTH27097.1 methylated-DNA--[protein]-cysteine S-methyltransferase [Staphylococcus auricularis]
MLYQTYYDAPIGRLTLTSDGEALTGLYLPNQANEENEADACINHASLPIFQQARRWLDRYFKGEEPETHLPVKPSGTLFQERVWRILREIPYGTLWTYGEIAKRIAKETGKARMSAQAVGGAVGRNPISIVIPCHRVIGANGNLTGYGGGIETKIKLLSNEHVDLSGLHQPH